MIPVVLPNYGTSVADPDQGSGAFVIPESWIRMRDPGWKKSGSGRDPGHPRLFLLRV
jgi:hypothetical protein